jgi:assimilatory nitrate reductase catalytic subunit
LLALKRQDGRTLTRWASDTFRCAPNDLIEYKDTALGLYRAALITRGRLDACVFLSATEALPTFQGLAALFGESALDAAGRKALLSGEIAAGGTDPGRIVCSCFAVGVNRLNEAIARRSLKSTEDVGALLRAGTNCGSCLPEIRALLADA